jgi:VWFA-related protein
LLFAAFMWTAVPAPGQEVEIPEVFSETIDVRVVNVEVVVTDGQGNRVRGLKASDFELLVDGDPTPIDYFTEIEDGLAREAGNDVAAVPSLDANAHVATNYLIYVDDLFSIRQDRDLVFTRLEEDLRELHPTDRVAAVAFDGASMETLTAWTNSREGLAKALDRARRRDPGGLRRYSEAPMPAQDRELRATLESLDRRASLVGIGRRFATMRADQLHRSVLAAVAAMRRFGDQRGRKVLLLLAGGWPESIALHAASGNLDAPPDPTMAMSADEL